MDVVDPSIRREVALGDFTLVLGDPAGTAIVPADCDEISPLFAQEVVPADGREDARSLAQALAQARREHTPRRTAVEVLEEGATDAAGVAAKAERVIGLFTEIAQRRLDPASISDEVGALCDLAQRLDREGRHKEALRLIRALTMLLALLGRWIELLRSLRVAVGAAEQIADDLDKAWALHEQGTWNLAAHKHAEADKLLGKARDLRKRIGDRRGLSVTERNLQALCHTLRAELHPPRPDPSPPQRFIERLLRKPLLALGLVLSSLFAAGVAGAAISGGGTNGDGASAVAADHKPSLPPKAAFSSQPASPRVGELVHFDATGSSDPDPKASIRSYTWKFGDEHRATGSTATHAYAQPGAYTVELIVTNTRKARDRIAHTITVKDASPSGPTAPSAPSAPTASAGDGRATLAWTAPADGGSAITSYTVTPYVGTEAQAPTHIDGSPPGTSTTITGLLNGTAYTFTIVANNAVGPGPASAHSNPVTPAAVAPGPTAPSAPADVTATASEVSASVEVSWVAPADGGSAITSYKVTPYERTPEGGEKAERPTMVNGSPPGTTTTIPGLTEHATYTFTVIAINSVGEGGPSEHSKAVTPP